MAATWLALVLYGAIVFLPQGVTHLYQQVWPPPCAEALQLIVITEPENIPTVRDKADAFTRDETVDGCPKYRILVSPTPPVNEMM
ncbi:hypothetical protein [Spongiactinospora gelatinilytica]|uniref:hypothetical protein n=1 Tax=Spongiactinospora gelatinilytica TaxID=2666298 RepID=UPI0011B94276|nr:hypothetical protein [Spongiactinospora gelatinilytica]